MPVPRSNSESWLAQALALPVDLRSPDLHGPLSQIRLVPQSCPTLCNPMNRSTPGLPVHHQLPEFTETHVHRVSDAIQPSPSLLFSAICKGSSDNHFAFLHFFFLGRLLITVQCHEPPSIVLQALCLLDLIPCIYLSLLLLNVLILAFSPFCFQAFQIIFTIITLNYFSGSLLISYLVLIFSTLVLHFHNIALPFFFFFFLSFLFFFFFL